MVVNDTITKVAVKNEISPFFGKDSSTQDVDESFFNELMLILEGLTIEGVDEEEELAKYMPMFIPVQNGDEAILLEEQELQVEGQARVELSPIEDEIDFIPIRNNFEIQVKDDVEVINEFDVIVNEMEQVESREVYTINTESALKIDEVDSKEVLSVDEPVMDENVSKSHTKEVEIDNSSSEKVNTPIQTKALNEVVGNQDNNTDTEFKERDEKGSNKVSFEQVTRNFSMSQNTLQVETSNITVSESNVVENINYITETIVESIRQREIEGTVELKLRLKPEFIGDVEITLKETENKIQAFLKISNEELKEAMHQKVFEIETILKDHGVNIDKIEFSSFTSQFDASNARGNERHRHSRKYQSSFRVMEKDAPEEEIRQIVNTKGRINYLV